MFWWRGGVGEARQEEKDNWQRTYTRRTNGSRSAVLDPWCVDRQRGLMKLVWRLSLWLRVDHN